MSSKNSTAASTPGQSNQGNVPKLEWKFQQVFGDKASSEKVSDEDIISAISFDKSGKYLSLGNQSNFFFKIEVHLC